MAEERHACEDGLTPECFKKYPQYAKKVLAYRLMHTLCPARMTTKLREALWKALIRVPVSFIPFDAFIFPPDFNWEMVFPPDWTPGDPVPLCVIVEPDAEFPEGWMPGDPVPDGVTIDLSLILPPDWETADPLPFGITVDPTYRIQIPQLKLMYIFIRPGETWESVFPNGWDPTGPLPDGASWNPYLVFPGDVSIKDHSIEPLTPRQLQRALEEFTEKRFSLTELTEAQKRRSVAAEYGTTAPTFMDLMNSLRSLRGGPVVIASQTWFEEPWKNFTDNDWNEYTYDNATIEITDDEELRHIVSDESSYTMPWRDGDSLYSDNFDIEVRCKDRFSPGSHTFAFNLDDFRIYFTMEAPTIVRIRWKMAIASVTVPDFTNKWTVWQMRVRAGYMSLWMNGIKVSDIYACWEWTSNPGRMSEHTEKKGTYYTDYIIISEWLESPPPL